MSVITKESKRYTRRPSIKETPYSVVIEAGFFKGRISIFLWQRNVEIIPSIRQVHFSNRTAYFFKKEEQVHFSDLWYINQAYKAVEHGDYAEGFEATDITETFRISLVTRDGRDHFVGSFSGSGAVCTGWTGVLLGGDSLIDYSGTQASEANQFLHYLSRLLDIPLGKPPEGEGHLAICPNCDKPTAMYVHEGKCLNCGKQVW